MSLRAPYPRQLVGLGSRIGQAVRDRVEASSVEDLERTAGAARRRIERARFRNDVAYAQHLITRALRDGRSEHDEQGSAT